MRGTKAKLIRKKAKELLVTWLSSMLDPKELPKLTEKNLNNF